MSLEAVEKLVEETEEARAYQREVSDLLAGVMTNEEEDEVEDELAALEREVCNPPSPFSFFLLAYDCSDLDGGGVDRLWGNGKYRQCRMRRVPFPSRRKGRRKQKQRGRLDGQKKEQRHAERRQQRRAHRSQYWLKSKIRAAMARAAMAHGVLCGFFPSFWRSAFCWVIILLTNMV